MLSRVGDEIIYPFQKFNVSNVEVCEWIKKIISHFKMDVITYPGWDQG